MKTVLTYGTFDVFHIGHLNMLQRLADLGDRLIVGVSTDEFNQLKGKRSLLSYEDRSAVVAAIRCVDLVIPEAHWEQKARDIQTHTVDILGIGDDWTGKFDHLKDQCEVIYLPRSFGISSTTIRGLAIQQSLQHLRRVEESLAEISSIFETFGFTNFHPSIPKSYTE